MTKQALPKLPQAHLRRLAKSALKEDQAWQDVTTAALVSSEQKGRGVIIAREEGVLAGLPMTEAVFKAVDPSLQWRPLAAEGSHLSPGQEVARIEGPLAAILRGERVALNYLTHLSGVATATARLVAAIAGLPVGIRDTRKTTPGLRTIEKCAVRVGGGQSHRLTLADAVLIKDNHLVALRARGLGIAEAVRLASQQAPTGMRVQIEVTTVDEARQALEAGAGELLLDNMPTEDMRRVVEMARGRAVLEASGGINLDNVRQVAETGVDYISVGAMTHSARALDMSLQVEGLKL
ncbi:MAG: carboxylating nicotinate-nucleotide diphosphorylase [Dehalococcoidia bacterium]|nr:MAG: carboxylating nicotinate-nucleotide diphosphorylase [Dehalococcoidia bacterium]